jgi:AcrR family transcriptional regulator
MDALKQLPKIPRQARSKERQSIILKSSEEIIKDLGPTGLTLKGIAEHTNLKRASLYKLFPSVESIIYSLGESHVKKLLSLIEENCKQIKSQDLDYYLNIFIDISSIYLNQQSYLAFLLINLNMNFHAIEQTIKNQEHLAISFLLIIEKQDIKIDKEKIMIAIQIIFAVLGHGLRSKGVIDSKTLNNTKRSVLAFLSI